MGKKRIVKTESLGGSEAMVETAEKEEAKTSGKKRLEAGILHVRSTYNNTTLLLSDKKGNVVASESSGKLGFRGAKKGTPFAAAKVGEILGARAHDLGVREVNVVVKGVGSGRESAIRGFISKGINITSIRDATPMPHNGPKPKKPRRV